VFPRVPDDVIPDKMTMTTSEIILRVGKKFKKKEKDKTSRFRCPAPPTACVCGRSLAGIAGSNPAWGMDVCLL